MTITQNDICQLTCAIWQSTLGLEVRPISGPSLLEQRACIVMARVPISGAWQGAVLLQCSEKLAKKVARAMFGLDVEEPSSDEVRDALAEITHVTAGNLKSLVCGNCRLSTPQVTERALDSPIATEEGVVSRQAFDCQGELFVVAILAREADHRGSLERPEACRRA
jgi:chemotaxis protein CheX